MLFQLVYEITTIFDIRQLYAGIFYDICAVRAIIVAMIHQPPIHMQFFFASGAC